MGSTLLSCGRTAGSRPFLLPSLLPFPSVASQAPLFQSRLVVFSTAVRPRSSRHPTTGPCSTPPRRIPFSPSLPPSNVCINAPLFSSSPVHVAPSLRVAQLHHPNRTLHTGCACSSLLLCSRHPSLSFSVLSSPVFSIALAQGSFRLGSCILSTCFKIRKNTRLNSFNKLGRARDRSLFEFVSRSTTGARTESESLALAIDHERRASLSYS